MGSINGLTPENAQIYAKTTPTVSERAEHVWNELGRLAFIGRTPRRTVVFVVEAFEAMWNVVCALAWLVVMLELPLCRESFIFLTHLLYLEGLSKATRRSARILVADAARSGHDSPPSLHVSSRGFAGVNVFISVDCGELVSASCLVSHPHPVLTGIYARFLEYT